MGYYDYEELRTAATAPDATQEAVNALGEWFEAHGMQYWNGEYFDADGLRLYPIVAWDEETDTGKTTGYEFR